eukprot:TRINITY_DN6884_c0_g1_i1.p2 TRINITY_DN6884_c0_g1~~TRINITY_DN6884_c0_g1_i1.p2  ORF type:complete len:107 (+),score=16.17 TRINITY_DN6884_c0_g1_i1:542-862(+)
MHQKGVEGTPNFRFQAVWWQSRAFLDGPRNAVQCPGTRRRRQRLPKLRKRGCVNASTETMRSPGCYRNRAAQWLRRCISCAQQNRTDFPRIERAFSSQIPACKYGS